jgi:hypothetical protein
LEPHRPGTSLQLRMVVFDKPPPAIFRASQL